MTKTIKYLRSVEEIKKELEENTIWVIWDSIVKTQTQ
jgi:hypothetical protein